jgi:predicted deacylase
VNVEAYSERLHACARASGFVVEKYGRIGDFDLPVLVREGDVDPAPSVYLSAGVHGDEPAGPIAVLELLKRKLLPGSARLTVFPLVNPEGLVRRTRTNAEGIDLNRDYGFENRSVETRAQLDWIGDQRFNLVLCLHEDSDGEGFYVYTHDEQGHAVEYATLALEAARPYTGIDPREEIDDMPARNGQMRPPPEVVDRNRTDLPEALRLFFHHGPRLTITTETPSGFAITNRVEAQCAAVSAILDRFLANR